MLGTVQNDKLSETENIIEKNRTFFAFFLYLPSVSVTPHWQTPQKKIFHKLRTGPLCQIHCNVTANSRQSEGSTFQAQSATKLSQDAFIPRPFGLRAFSCVRSDHVTSTAPITWLWNLTLLWVIRPVGIYREGPVSVFHSSCVKWSSPGRSASRTGKLAWKGILQEWLTCLRALRELS